MLGIQQYKKLQELKALGLSKLKVSEQLNLSYKTVCNWWIVYIYAFLNDLVLTCISTQQNKTSAVILRIVRDLHRTYFAYCPKFD